MIVYMSTPASSKLWRFGVRQKVILALLAVLFLSLSTSTWLAFKEQQKNSLVQSQHRAADILRYVSQSLVYSVVGYDYHTINLLLDELVKSEEIVYGRVESKHGNVMAEAGTLPAKDSGALLYERNIILDGKETIGKVFLGVSTESINQSIEQQTKVLLLREGLILVLIGFAEFLVLSLVTIRPISVIANSIRASMDDKTDMVTREIPLNSNDEFGDIAHEFNELRAKLNNANQRLKNKVELANNELIKINNELALKAHALEHANQELHQLSITDTLTGLFNRRYFEQLVEFDFSLCLRHGEVNSILIFDLDYFKKINDTWGHTTGDQVLRIFGQILQENVRKTDIVCRIGGEEFVLWARRADKQSSLTIAEKIREKVAQQVFDAQLPDLKVTVSIGVATFNSGTGVKSYEELFQSADEALYASKMAGRNRVTHSSDMKKNI